MTKEWNLTMTNGISSLTFVTQTFWNCQPIHNDDNKTFEVATSILRCLHNPWSSCRNSQRRSILSLRNHFPWHCCNVYWSETIQWQLSSCDLLTLTTGMKCISRQTDSTKTCSIYSKTFWLVTITLWQTIKSKLTTCTCCNINIIWL